jgi:hypothetical protein
MGRPQIALPDTMPTLSLGYSQYVPPSPTPSDEGEMCEFGPIRDITPRAQIQYHVKSIPRKYNSNKSTR